MSTSFFLLFLSIIFSAIAVSSCKSDKSDGDALKNSFKANKDFVNFLVNDTEKPGKDRIGMDIPMKSYLDEYRRDKDYVHYVNLGDTVIFEDISTWVEGTPPDERKWMVGITRAEETGAVFKYLADIEGTEYVTLKFTDQVKISKGIVVVARSDEEPEYASEEIIEDDEYDNEDMYEEDASASIDEQPDFSQPERKQETAVVKAPPARQTKKSEPTSRPVAAAKPTSRPAPKPAPVKKALPPISKVDFSASKMEVGIGESIIFRDQSEPAISVKQRVWDWGDGNTLNASGQTSKFAFYKAGTYNVKLCINYTSNCKTKAIVVKETEKAKEIFNDPVPAKTETKPAVEVKKIALSRVTISSASSSIVGKSIEVKDDSYPAEAVENRTWFINGEKANFTSKKFNKAFDKAGTYTIKLCVNGSAKCESKTITVKDKPKPPPPPPTTNKATTPASSSATSVDDFYPMEDSFTGLRSSQRCTADSKKWHGEKAEVILTPKKMCQLLNATVYGKKVGKAKVTLSEVGGTFTRSMKNVQILPGGSTVEFGDLAIVLVPGKKYSLSIEPMSGEAFTLEDGGACNTTFAGDNKLGVEYKDNIITLYEIRFEF